MERTVTKSEWIELEALRAVYDSAPNSLKQTSGLKFEDIKGITCCLSTAEPSILLNRCFVTHESSLKDIASIKAVKQFYADAGVSEFFLHVTNSDPDTGNILEQAGMKKSRGWMKFIRDISPATTRNPELTIRKIGPEYAEDFARIVVPCFDMTEAAIPLVANIINHPH